LAVSRGRMSQYRIMKSNKDLSNHLLDTAMYTEDALISFLELYESVMIKPVFGLGKTYVVPENGKFRIHSGNEQSELLDKEELHPYISEKVIKHKKNIIQPSPLHSNLFQYPLAYFITVHRCSPVSEWVYTSKTEKYKSFLDKYRYLLFFNKMKRLSIQAAIVLGDYFSDCHTIVIDILIDLKGKIWIQETSLHFPKSKWCQYQTFSSNPKIAPLVPKTDLLTEVTFSDYLNKYKNIIIKPCVGQQGKGIAKITMADSSAYEIHAGRKKIIKTNINEAYDYIKDMYLAKKAYLVQEALSLAELDDCPADVRVITQKEDSMWKSTGKIVKVASKNFFVTNVAQRLLTLEETLQNLPNLNININDFEYEIDKKCVMASELLEENHPNIKMVGFDIGISSQGDIWIIEGNYKPDLSMFSRLRNKEMYRTIRKVMKGQRKKRND